MTLATVLFSGIVSSLAVYPLSAEENSLSHTEWAIDKEPKYESQRLGYLLLVFGPKAESRCWVVYEMGDRAAADGETTRMGDRLYVDRNGNGDLTDPGECVQATVRTVETIVSFSPGIMKQYLPTFDVGTITELATKLEHSDVRFDVNYAMGLTRPGLSMKLAGSFPMFPGEFDLSFAPTAAEAPVIHLRGPLTLRPAWSDSAVLSFTSDGELQPREPQVLTAGEESDLFVNIGSFGLGRGSFASLSTEAVPGEAHPVAEIEFSNRQPGNSPIRRTYVLSHRC
jgi:hypothetical protein